MTAHYDPWAPPPAGMPQPAGKRSPVPVFVIGTLVLLLLAAGITWAVVRRRSAAPSNDTPVDALRAWFKAAESGDAERIRAAVAPSQRQYVSASDPTALGLPRLEVEDLSVGPATRGTLSPDEAYVDVGAGSTCLDRCYDVTGTGPEQAVLVLREGGRWWVVAAPVRLVEQRRPAPTASPT